ERMRAGIAGQQRDSLVGGLESVGKAAGEIQQRKQLEDALAKIGIDPVLARHPDQAAQAILEKARASIQQKKDALAAKERGFDDQGNYLGADKDPQVQSA